ncbi:MAG: DUF4398 domain-containing protein [Gammaproteobacteria bacterium]|nr:MAG: DUF4398 domain-containing protein [Gammaproteobacteria bacterium]
MKLCELVVAKNRINFFSLILILAVAFLQACSYIPVQEMSDARQTLRSAQEVGAAKYAAESLAEAEVLLEKARKKLDDGDYDAAKKYAVEAQSRASAARDISIKRAKGMQH